MNPTARLPITIVTGFLGSGKTTLLRCLLADDTARDTAVLVNEFGAIGLDHHLLQRLDEHTVLLPSGCVCCTVRDDLVQALRALLDRHQQGDLARLHRVMLETTGLADPAPILFTVLTDPRLQHHFRIERVITTVDAVNGHLHLTRQPQSLKQVVSADDIVMTKTDLAPPDTVSSLMVRLQTLNPTARLHTAVLGRMDPRVLLGTSGNHAALTTPPSASPRTAPPTTLGASALDGPHASATRSLALSFTQPLDWIAFSVWLSMLLHAHGENVLRVKGLLNVGLPGPVVLNGVQHILHPPEHLPHWGNGDQRSHLVFIVQNIAPHAIVQSLQTFQHMLGATPTVEYTAM